MAQQKRGLGRGLGALIPAAPGPAGLGSHASEPADAATTRTGEVGPEPQADAGAYIDGIPIGAIPPNPRQPRQPLDQDGLEEPAASRRGVGLLQPVVGRQAVA